MGGAIGQAQLPMIERSVIIIRTDGIVMIRLELGLAAIDRMLVLCCMVVTLKELKMLIGIKCRAKLRCCAIAFLVLISLHGVGLVWSIAIKHFLSQL